MDEVIELSDSSDDTEVFHHDLSDRDEWVAEGYSGGDSEDKHWLRPRPKFQPVETLASQAPFFGHVCRRMSK